MEIKYNKDVFQIAMGLIVSGGIISFGSIATRNAIDLKLTSEILTLYGFVLMVQNFILPEHTTIWVNMFRSKKNQIKL